jgi:hypothetical protein
MADPFNSHDASACIDAIDNAVVSHAHPEAVGRASQLLAGGGPVRVLLEEVDLFADSVPERRREREQVS